MAVVATGFFDGVHLGHQEVINIVVSSAHKKGEEATIITFSRHPRAVLQQDAHSLRLLNTLSEKIYRLKSLGVDRVEVLDFTKSFASLSALEYLKLLVSSYGASTLVMGYDNRLGSDKLSPNEVQLICEDLGLEFIVVEAFSPERGNLVASTPISSTKIRSLLSGGDVESAAELLGYNYSLKGVVVGGKQLGRKLGFPTANMSMYDPLKLIPGRGVYLTRVHCLEKEYYGMTNIGDIVETHIFDFNEDIYGLDIEISFLKRLRNSCNFPTLDELKTQLAKDRETCFRLIR